MTNKRLLPAFTSASSIDPPSPTKSPCPAGYISWYTNCYKLVEQPATWDDAQESCEREGGDLTSIDMSYDQAFVAGAVLQGKADAWIGLRIKVPVKVFTGEEPVAQRKNVIEHRNNQETGFFGHWRRLLSQDDGYAWTDGWPVFFTHWGPGEPTNNRGEGCVSMHASRVFHGTWNDTKCDHEKPYICKISSGTDFMGLR